MPVKFLLMIRLMTPETASEPQAAEAPPVTTSMRWIMVLGMTEGRRRQPMRGDDALAVKQDQVSVGAQVAQIDARDAQGARVAGVAVGAFFRSGRVTHRRHFTQRVADVRVRGFQQLGSANHRDRRRLLITRDLNARGGDHHLFDTGRVLRQGRNRHRGEQGGRRTAKHELLQQIIHYAFSPLDICRLQPAFVTYASVFVPRLCEAAIKFPCSRRGQTAALCMFKLVILTSPLPADCYLVPAADFARQ